MADKGWDVVSTEKVGANPWAVTGVTPLEPVAQAPVISPEELIGAPAEPSVPSEPVPLTQTEMRAWEPSLLDRITGLIPGNKAKAMNEYAARQIAKEKGISVDQVYRDAGGSRPIFNPEGRPAIQAGIEATKVLAKELPEVPGQVLSTALRTYRAGDIDSPIDEGWIDKVITSMEPDPGQTRDQNYESFQGLGKSLGFSLATMVASITSGAATTVATANPAVGVGVGMVTSGTVAYRASKDDFMSRVRDQLNQKSKSLYGHPMSQESWDQAKKEFNAAAVQYGLWEAIPEAVSNAIFLKAFSAPAKMANASRIKSLTEKAGALTAEQVTETVTGLGQNAAELKAGLTDQELNVVDAFKQQFIQTLAISGFMGGGLKAKDMAKQFYIDRVEPTISPGSAFGRAIQADLDAVAFSPLAIEKEAVARLSPDYAQMEVAAEPEARKAPSVAPAPPEEPTEGFEVVSQEPIEAAAPVTPVTPTEGLSVVFNGQTFSVDSIDDAQAKWIAFRDETGAGVSQIGNGVPIMDAQGNVVAKISYNGRVWDSMADDAKVIKEAPVTPVTPEAPEEGAPMFTEELVTEKETREAKPAVTAVDQAEVDRLEAELSKVRARQMDPTLALDDPRLAEYQQLEADLQAQLKTARGVTPDLYDQLINATPAQLKKIDIPKAKAPDLYLRATEDENASPELIKKLTKIVNEMEPAEFAPEAVTPVTPEPAVAEVPAEEEAPAEEKPALTTWPTIEELQAKKKPKKPPELTVPYKKYRPNDTFDLDGRKWQVVAAAHTGKTITAVTRDKGGFRRETFNVEVPSVEVLEGKAAANRERQEAQKEITENSKRELEIGDGTGEIIGNIKTINKFKVYKVKYGSETQYRVQSPFNRAMNRIGRDDSYHSDLINARAKAEGTDPLTPEEFIRDKKYYAERAAKEAEEKVKEKPEVANEGDVLLIEADEAAVAEALEPSDSEDERLNELFNPKQDPARPQPEKMVSPAEAKKIINDWKQEVTKQGRSGENADKTVISLFDASGEWSKPWAEAGFNVVTYDLQTGQDIKDFDAATLLEEHGNDNIWAILAAPPCTDFASSGAQYWAKKDADGRTEESNELIRQVLRSVELFRPPVWAMENPVGRMAKLNKLPPAQLTFQPNVYGDPYTKKTLLWGNFNNDLPQAPVEPTEGSKITEKISGGNKYARSLTPEGFAYAFFMANNPVGMAQEQRLSKEFHGISPEEFKGAGTEKQIRDAIQDNYYDGDLEAVRETLEQLKETPKLKKAAAKEEHVEAGESEPITKPVIQEAVSKGADRKDIDYTAMRKEIERQVDEAISKSPYKDDQEWGATYTSRKNFVTFDIPGDGKFKIKNNKERLEEFKKRLMAAAKPKVGKGPQFGIAPADVNTTLRDMVDANEIEAAIEYAALKGVKISESKLDLKQKLKVQEYLADPEAFEKKVAAEAELTEAQRQAMARAEEERRIATNKRLAEEQEKREKDWVNARYDDLIIGSDRTVKNILRTLSKEDANKILDKIDVSDDKPSQEIIDELQKKAGTYIDSRWKEFVNKLDSPLEIAKVTKKLFEKYTTKEGSISLHQLVEKEIDGGSSIITMDSGERRLGDAAGYLSEKKIGTVGMDYAGFLIAKRKKEKPAKTEELTDEQKENAQTHADEVGGEVVFQKGDYALIRGYAMLTGDPVYVPTFKTQRGRVDVESFTGTQIPSDIKQEMVMFKRQTEIAAEEKHKTEPFIKFDRGLAMSEDIPENIAGVIREWKNLLKLDVPIYVSTIEDAKKNRNNFTGPHRRIGSGTLDEKERGSMRRMADDSYYILFEKSASPTFMLEVIAHEMGHLHERLVYEKASPEEKAALKKAHQAWLEKQEKSKPARELVEALRGRAVGRRAKVPEDQSIYQMSSYWTSFGEWYADQVSRWAVSADTPVTIVEKFFKRLGNQLRQFYQKLKNAKYLPDETFVQYIERVTQRPADLAQKIQDLDVSEERNIPLENIDLAQIDRSLPNAKKRLPPGRSPELTAAAQQLKDGEITKDEYDALVNKYKPIPVYTEAMKPATPEQVFDALDVAKRDKINPQITNGTAVGLRLDIPAFNRKGIFVVSIHKKRTPSAAGPVIGYGSVAKVTNATFGLGKEAKALDIAAGASKDVLQTIEGKWVNITPEQAYKEAQEAIKDPQWIQIGIDPTRHSYFYDRRTTLPIVKADEVIQIGNMLLGKGVEFGKKEDFLYNIEAGPQLTERVIFEGIVDSKKEQIEELARLARKKSQLIKKVRNYGSDIETQRLLNELEEQIKIYRAGVAMREPVVSAEAFLKHARDAVDGTGMFREQSLSPEVFAVIQAAYIKTPWILEGLRLSVKTPKVESRASGIFIPVERIVRLYRGTEGVEDPTTVRHELMHSLEQMMSKGAKDAVIQAWAKAFERAIKKYTDKNSQEYFKRVMDFLENPTTENRNKATEILPSYELYQYINPSEYWAINAEKLYRAQLGTAWDRFKKAVRKLFEGLKAVFGFDNTYAVHKIFDQIMGTTPGRMGRSSITDYLLAGKAKIDFLENVQDDEKLIKKYNRPNTPMLNTEPVKNFVVNQGRFAKAFFKDALDSPQAAIETLFNSTARGVHYLRNKNVFMGAGLEVADMEKYGGMLRNSQGLAIASIALDNALHGPTIATQVIFRGGIRFRPTAGVFVAVDSPTSMVKVYEAEAKLKEKLGAQLGTDIIQGYLEAKRSRSIKKEMESRDQELEQLRNELDQMSPSDPDYERVRAEVNEAIDDLVAIQKAADKINMSEDEIDEFIAREKVHPELREIMDNFTGVNRNLLKFWRQVGLLSEARYNVLSNIEDYVPWYRIMDDEVDVHSPIQSTTRSMTNIGKEKLFKSGKPKTVVDFVAEDGQTEFKIQPSSVVGIRVNGVNVTNFKANEKGEITFAQPLAEGDVVVIETAREIENIIDNMTRNVMRMTMNGLRQYASMRIVQEYASRNEKNKIMVFPKADRNKGRFDYIANGKRVVVEIKDPLIAEAVYGMENIGMETFKALAAVANMTRRMITMNPFFQAKQVFKDGPSAAFITGVRNPAGMVGDVYTAFIKALKGGDETVEILRAAGIGGFQSPTRTPEAEVKRKIGVINKSTYDMVMAALDQFGDSSDVAQRKAIYDRVMKETGDEMRAIWQASTIMPFHRHGSGRVAQAIIKTVPFMGAYANSIDVLVRATMGGNIKGMSRKQALKYLRRAFYVLGGISLLYAFLAGMDDDYWELDDQTRLRNIILPFSKKMTGEMIMVPMNTGAAFIFKAIPELIYNYVITKGTDRQMDFRRAAKAFGEAAVDSLLGPEPIPSAVRPVAEIVLDRNFFTERKMTPAGLKDLEAADQFTSATSEIGKILGSVTDLMNPIEADHLIRSIFGTVGAMVQWGSNVIFAASRPEMTTKELPAVGGFVAPKYPRGKEELFYDFLEVTRKKHATFNDRLERMDADSAVEYMEKNAGLIVLYDYASQLEAELKEINKDIRLYGRATKEIGLTPKERREIIDNLNLVKRSRLEGIEIFRNLAEEIKVTE